MSESVSNDDVDVRTIIEETLSQASRLDEETLTMVGLLLHQHAARPIRDGSFTELIADVSRALPDSAEDISVPFLLALIDTDISPDFWDDLKGPARDFVARWRTMFGHAVARMSSADMRGARDWLRTRPTLITHELGGEPAYRIRFEIVRLDGEVLELEMSPASVVRLVRNLLRAVTSLSPEAREGIEEKDIVQVRGHVKSLAGDSSVERPVEDSDS